ncbi:MAG TPA: aspartyl-phosphate phosphatase Spo0E family protein [Bacillus bacterium]|nr:aspartyl-phosphate phosphatase Spo0E family protein [Bacillus sp. (in: firmicutes)]
MKEFVVKLALAKEIEELRRQLGEEWKQTHLLSNPAIVKLSQRLDVKINQYQNLSKK